MKTQFKKISLIVCLLASMATSSFAQKKLTEGILTYSVIENGTNIDSKVKFNGNLSSLSIQNGPAAIEIISDIQSKQSMVLVSVPIAQKMIAAKMSKKDVEEANGPLPVLSEITKTDETAKIAGFNATKYTFKDEKNVSGEVWVTTELELPLNILTGIFKDVTGTPIKSVYQDKSMTLKTIKESKVSDLSVTAVPKSFEEITYAEMKAMQGGR